MELTSSLVKSFVRVNSEGYISLPHNIRKALELKENQLLELKIIGTSRNRNLLISKSKMAR